MHLDLAGLLRDAAKTFRDYEEHHMDKQPPSLDKAQRNREMAQRLETALQIVTNSDRVEGIQMRNTAMTDAVNLATSINSRAPSPDGSFVTMDVFNVISAADAIFKYVMQGTVPGVAATDNQ